MGNMSHAMNAEAITKPFHTIVLDSSPLLLNTPGISTLLANGHVLITTPSVLAEIKNEEARSRIDTLYLPFLTVQSPKPESIKFVKDFARKTGDSISLSQTDYEVLALAYDLECERNGGNWRLRNTPGQKRVNGSPRKKEEPKVEGEYENIKPTDSTPDMTENASETIQTDLESMRISETDGLVVVPDEDTRREVQTQPQPLPEPIIQDSDSADSDEGWITPSNIKKHQAKDDSANHSSRPETRTLQVATMTGDFAMQNVLLQINLNLISTKTCKRITQIKQFILRCHACFNTTKDMSKQFCPRCGQPALTRVTCTTNEKGEFKLHLKANMQWNNRGNVYSIPKAGTGSASQKWKGSKSGGGQGGWGNDLVLAEDQKEYVRSMTSMQRRKEKDLMDQDVLPGLLSGERGRGGERMRVGAGRNINSRKR